MGGVGDFLNGIANQYSQPAGGPGYYTGGSGTSIWDLAKAQPGNILRDLIQAPHAVLSYGLGRFMEPSVANQTRNMAMASQLANLETQPIGRYAMMGDPRIAQMAGIPMQPLPPGGITAENAAQYGLSPEDIQFFGQTPGGFGMIHALPAGLPPRVITPKEELTTAQTEYERQLTEYIKRGGMPPEFTQSGLHPQTATVTMGPHGPTITQNYGVQPTYPGAVEPPGPGLVTPRPADRPAAPPARPVPPRAAATAPPAPLVGPPAPGAATGPPAPTAAPAAPTFAPGQTGTFTNRKTGETVQGTFGADNTFMSSDGTVRTYDPKTGALGPPTQGPQYPSPAFQEPGAAAGAQVGTALAPRAPVALSPAPIPPGAPPEAVGSPSAAFIPPRGPAPAAPPAPVAQGEPAKAVETPAPAAPSWQAKADFYAAAQANPDLREWLAAHPEYKTIEQKILGTAEYVRAWKERNRVEEAQAMTQARMSTPMRTQLSAIDGMIAREQAYITPDARGRIPLDVFPTDPQRTEYSLFLGGRNSPLGSVISPGGQGLPNPFSQTGEQIFETIPGIARRPEHPDHGLATTIMMNEKGLLAELARATSVSGRLTNYEQANMRDAYIPSPGMDTRASAVEKVKQTLQTLHTIRQALVNNQMTTLDVSSHLNPWAQPGPVSPETTVRVVGGE